MQSCVLSMVEAAFTICGKYNDKKKTTQIFHLMQIDVEYIFSASVKMNIFLNIFLKTLFWSRTSTLLYCPCTREKKSLTPLSETQTYGIVSKIVEHIRPILSGEKNETQKLDVFFFFDDRDG